MSTSFGCIHFFVTTVGVGVLNLFLLLSTTTLAYAQDDNIFALSSSSSSNTTTTTTTTTTTSYCTICKDGNPVVYPDAVPIREGPLGGQDCATMDSLVRLLYPNASSSSECRVVQSLGSLCGCPSSPSSMQNTCSLCPHKDEVVTNPDKPLPFLSYLFADMLTPTCAMMEAYLQFTENSADHPMCTLAQTYMADYCGCNRNPNPQTNKDSSSSFSEPCSVCPNKNDILQSPNRTFNMEGFPFETCQQLQEGSGLLLQEGSNQCASLKGLGHYCGCSSSIDHVMMDDSSHDDGAQQGSCFLCSGGEPVPNPDEPLVQFRRLFGGLTPTCAIVESTALQLFQEGSDDCQTVQLFGSYCGCRPLESHCQYCADLGDEIPPEYNDRPVPAFELYFGDQHDKDLRCKDVWLTQHQITPRDDRCFYARTGSYHCGCNGGESIYMSAKTKTQKFFLAWLPRLSGTLSVLVCDNRLFPLARHSCVVALLFLLLLSLNRLHRDRSQSFWTS